MLEYIMKAPEDLDNSNDNGSEHMYFTKLLDNHYAIIWPNTYEVTFNNGIAVFDGSVQSYNTLNHTAVPADRKSSNWYTFIDTNYEYTDENELSSIKADQYMKYMVSPDNSDETIKTIDINTPLGYDEIRLYFVNGYDFSDIFGFLCRIFLETDYIGADRKTNPQFIDLCNFFLTKGTWYKLATFLPEPIIFGNAIYDRYISINVPSLKDIWYTTDSDNIGETRLNNILHIRENAPIHIMMASVEEGDYEMKRISKSTVNTLQGIINETSFVSKTNTLVNCEFSRTSTLNGAIPTESLTSDRLGTYIALNNELNCIEYCTTWQDNLGNIKPLTAETVSLFNYTINLYDRSLIRQESVYEVDDDYNINSNNSIRNWVILHKLNLSYVDINMNTLKTETYTMTQTFENIGGNKIFYYRPFITDSSLLENTSTIIVEYESRFMNTRDMVQFYNMASLHIDPTDINKYYYNNAHLMLGDTDVFSSITPYKVYNKIIETKQELGKNVSSVNKIKYVKTFYNSTDVALESTNGAYYTSGNIEINLSPAPKNYKFVIKYRKTDGGYDYMDLTDGYYKLYAKDNNNNDIVIEPTYSSNMNLLLGELEFAIDTKTINKLMNVDANMRKMSIVAYNADNSVSSLFDFSYNF